MIVNLLITGIFFALAVGIFTGYAIHKNSVSKNMMELEYYKSTYLRKTGTSQGYGSYQLRSFDGGRNWYAVETDNGSMIIKGKAEEVFPGLLAHLEGWDKFIDYVEKNGPITLSGKRATEELSILTGAGFAVEAK